MSKFKNVIFLFSACFFLFLSFGFQEIAEATDKRLLRDEIVKDVMLDVKVIIPIALAFLAALYTGYMQIWGIAKIVRAKLNDAESKAIIKKQIDDYLAEKKAESVALKSKKFYVVSPNVDENKMIDDFLKIRGFTGCVTVTGSLPETAATNALIVFNNRHGDLDDDTVRRIAAENSNAVYFYFTETGRRWNDANVKIVNGASFLNTLESNLLKALK